MAEIDDLLKEYDKKPSTDADASDIDHLLKLYPDTSPIPMVRIAPLGEGAMVDEYGRRIQPLANVPTVPNIRPTDLMRPPTLNAAGGDQFVQTRPAPNQESQSYQEATNALMPSPGTTYGNMLPFARDDATGALRFAMPGSLRDFAQGGLDLAYGPSTGTVTPAATNSLATLATGGLPRSPAYIPGRFSTFPLAADAPTRTPSGELNPAGRAANIEYNNNPLAAQPSPWMRYLTEPTQPAPLEPSVGQGGAVPAFVPPNTPGQLLPRIRQLIEQDNQIKANQPEFVPPGAAQPANPLVAREAGATGAPLNVAPIKTEAPKAAENGVIPNGLTPEQIAEFRNIPEALPPMKGEIKTQADAAKRADEIINHFASIGNKEPIPGAEGALPTITGNAGLATLYRAVRDSDTPVPFTTLETAAKNKAGAALSDLVQTPDALRAGEAAVDAKTAPMREAVFANKTAADPTPVVQTIDQIIASPSGMSDAVVNHLTKVRDKLVDKDGNIQPRAMDPEQLYGLDKAIRKDISPLAAGTTSDARLAAHELMNVQAALRPVINDAAPGFNDYMRTYSEMQRPLDEMRYLQGRNLTNMMDETTLAKVNGMLKDIEKQRNSPGIKLPDSLSPETMDKLRTIHDQMQRENFTATAGKALGSNTFQNLATNTMTGKIAGHVGNALVSTGAGMLTDLAAGGGGLTGTIAGAATGGALRGYAAKQAVKAETRQAAGQQMLMRELRDRLLNVDNKGVTALRGSPQQ